VFVGVVSVVVGIVPSMFPPISVFVGVVSVVVGIVPSMFPPISFETVAAVMLQERMIVKLKSNIGIHNLIKKFLFFIFNLLPP
jgi:hypothetical protein